MNFFYLYQTPIPDKLEDSEAKEIINIASRLSCCSKEYEELAKANKVECRPIAIRERIELMAKLDALVAHHYRLTKEEYKVIINGFDGFEEDKNLENLKEIKWDDILIKKLNGEVRKRVLNYYDTITDELKKRSKSK